MRCLLAWWLIGDDGREDMIESEVRVVEASNGVVVSSSGMV